MLKHFLVREYACKKYLSMAKYGRDIVEIKHIDQVKQESNNAMNTKLDGEVIMTDVTVIAVLELDSYRWSVYYY